MKNLFIFIITIIIFSSCERQEVNKDKLNTNERIYFQNGNEFIQTYDLLSRMESPEDILQWVHSKNHESVLFSDDSNICEFSPALKAILNSDYEFQIGDSIIWFENGNMYAFPKDSESDLESLKLSKSNAKLVGSVTIEKSQNKLKTVYIGDNNGAKDARNQMEFWQSNYKPCGGNYTGAAGWRKYVHELYIESFWYNYTYRSNLYLVVKLEYKDSKGRWNAAGEQRKISYDVTVNAAYYPGIGPIPSFRKTGSIDCFSGNLNIFLTGIISGVKDYAAYWLVGVNGTINHGVKGDNAANIWNNTGTLW